MAIDTLLSRLGAQWEDPDEESFFLFSHPIPSQNLGFVDPDASSLELTVAGRDLTILQSPTILSSNRSGGTTGAVVWKISPLFADWIASPQNILFQTSLLDAKSNVLELGCGISGVVGLALAPFIGTYVATDQAYVLKLLNQNIEENTEASSRPTKAPKKRPQPKPSKHSVSPRDSKTPQKKVKTMSLDWELDEFSGLSEILGQSNPNALDSDQRTGLDAVIACDCIYNEALVEPLVRTCAEVCSLRQDGSTLAPTLCIVAQQLRSPDVFEAWAACFDRYFNVWRVPDELLTDGLKMGSGYVVHLGILIR
ncbi:hypothetical protein L228DRAFT_265880 [Xylona heveae TC161]|uniref:Diaminohydroxyphosphoribosylamino-pyrimidine deaminase n=1 Tax=Xylona heveae (strain CBS 132557 / TC161) TaxID=1328760 RepID=A0A165IUK7_XYLHT|nr:hypothetical protein L228DRAFT_265880 [Xylona heveae TC161]KZF25411.1 hypothetical protein L228DRAFT_265880 [Xylona heveae TC161]